MNAAPITAEPALAALPHGGGAWWGTLALAGCGIALAALLRATRSRRAGADGISAWAIAAGLCVAAALGPAVAGRVQPALYERFIGGLPHGTAEAAAADAARAELRARIAAESALGASPASPLAAPSEGLAEATERARRADDDALRARLAYAWPRHATAAWLAALLLVMCLPRLRGTASPPGALTVAAWCAALPGLLGYALMRLWVGADPAPSAAAAAALAIGATFPTALSWRTAQRADGAGGALCAHAGAWAWPAAGAALAASIAMATREGSSGMRASTWAAVALACGVCIAAPAAGRLLRPAAPPASGAARRGMRSTRARALAIDCTTAAMVAVAAGGADPIQWNWLWTALAVGLVAEDGRCLAGWAACALQGTHTVRDAARVGAMSEESSRPMAALAAVAAAAGLVAPGLFAALAAGALAVDVTWGMRRRIALAPAQRAPSP